MIWCEIWHFVLQIVSWSIIKGMQHQKQNGNYQTAADKGDNKFSTVQIVSKQVIYETSIITEKTLLFVCDEKLVIDI